MSQLAQYRISYSRRAAQISASREVTTNPGRAVPSRQHGEPDFNLIEPTGQRRREVKWHSSAVLGEPIVIPFVSAVVVQNHMDLFVWWQFGDRGIEEPAEVGALLLLVHKHCR